ncbi:divalent-cation tolerance protein CutA [Oscillatoria salina]|uniref:divalent-cation tolerance protein CutA n=1 Tax=Oscillatoria salina TaxID=331517 RepID=UPI001CD008B8|nr:divalent-cation tolerance protein CutA [Oscillatoria salina]
MQQSMSSTSRRYGVVLVTASTKKEAENIASALVEAKLAACVSLTAVNSIYTWQGKVNSEEEWQLIIKSDLALFPVLEAKIKELHSYEVPEIIALPLIAGSQSYLQWIGENVLEI